MGNSDRTPTPRQAVAISTTGKSVSVSAAAGSGKTYVLTERIIRYICDKNGDISRILAVTFTKAAASEMISRIRTALNKKIEDESLDPTEKSRIAKQALLVGSAKICTVDKFCLDLLKDNIQTLGLESGFSTGDEKQINNIFVRTLRELIDDYFENRITDDDEKIDNFPLFTDTFGNFSSLDDFCDVIKTVYGWLSTRTLFIDELSEVAEMYKYSRKTDFFESDIGKPLKQFTLDAFGHYARVFKSACDYTADSGDKYEKEFLDLYNVSKGVVEAVGTGKGYTEILNVIQMYKKGQNRQKSSDNSDEMKFYKSEREAFIKAICCEKGKYGSLSKFYVYDPKDIEKTSEATRQMILKLRVFMTAFEKRFAREKQRNRIVSFNDIERMALELLRSKETKEPTDLALRLQNSFDEIYVDEYQDTNQLQSEIFSLISRKDNIFRVGDVKQSVYGFRGAVPEIFNELIDSSVKIDTDTQDIDNVGDNVKIYLSENFRSTHQVIDFCNDVFTVLMNDSRTKYGEDEKLYPGRDLNGLKPEIYPIEKESGEDTEAGFIAGKILSLVNEENYSYSDIAVLVRKNSEADGIIAALEANRIPYKSNMDVKYFDTPEVMLLVSLLNVIDNPARDIHLAGVLESPLYGFGMEDLIAVRKAGGGSLYDALKTYCGTNDFPMGNRFLSDLDEYREYANNNTCDKLIRYIYSKKGVLPLLSGCGRNRDADSANAKSNLLKLYSLSRTFYGGAYRSLFEFVSYINDLYENGDVPTGDSTGGKSDAVTVTSIHKSKGLEFDVCFLAKTDSPGGGRGSGEISISDSTLAPKLVADNGVGKVITMQVTMSELAHKMANLDESLRVLYVAITRAKKRLIITHKTVLKEKQYSFKRKFFDKYSLYQLGTFKDMIYTAVYSDEAGDRPYVICSGAQIISSPQNTDAAAPEEENETVDIVLADTIIEERLPFVYQYSDVNGVPAKVSVSKLYPDFLDDYGFDNVDDMEEKQIPSYVPAFIGGSTEAGAADKGTATHRFMEFCDFDRVDSDGVKSEIDRLVGSEFISKAESELIEVPRVESFFKSKAAEMIRNSGEVYREKRFIFAAPASHFTNNADLRMALKNEQVMIQGVIDCIFKDENGDYIIIDYKTDRFPKTAGREEIEKVLIERHSKQLSYYRYAGETMFGHIRHTYIYSFALNDLVETFETEEL